jgi:hypothetical protein
MAKLDAGNSQKVAFLLDQATRKTPLYSLLYRTN